MFLDLKKKTSQHFIIVQLSSTFFYFFIYFSDIPSPEICYAKISSFDYRNPAPDSSRIFLPDSRLFLPHLSLPDDRRRRSGFISDDFSHTWHRICSLRRSNPDFTLPPDRRLPGKGTRLFAGQPRTLTIDRPAADLFDLHLRRFSRRARPSCARMCAASARTRPLDPLLRDPCLLLRVLLWAQKNGSPGIFTGGRAVHPHFLRPADRPCLPHEQDSDHGAAGCLGAVDRGSGIGGVLSAGLWMLEVRCHTAKCKHTYYSPAPPPPHHGTPPHGESPHAQLSPESRSHLCTEPASPLRALAG